MIVCGLFEWERIAPGLCYRLFISVLPVGDPIIKLRWDGITWAGLLPPNTCAYQKILTLYVVFSFVFNDFRWLFALLVSFHNLPTIVVYRICGVIYFRLYLILWINRCWLTLEVVVLILLDSVSGYICDFQDKWYSINEKWIHVFSFEQSNLVLSHAVCYPERNVWSVR
jgi:hypothetical protein